MRIAIDARTVNAHKSGVGEHVYNLIKALGKTNEENEYFLFVNYKNVRDFQPGRFKQICTSISLDNHPMGDIWENLLLPRRLINEKINVFHSPAFILPLRRLNCSTVVTIHDLIVFLFPKTFPRRFTIYMKFMISKAVKKADKIITVSHSTRKDIVNLLKVPEGKIEVVYGAPNQVYRPVADKKMLETAKEKYGIYKKYILCVGTLEPRKNISRIIEAYYNLKRANASFDYNLVFSGGKGWLYSSIFQILRKFRLEDDVVFTGYVPANDLCLLYNAAELFVYASLYEGFGLPPLEAMACGTPVISSNVSSLPEVIGDVGILVNPYSMEELAEAILKLLSDDDLRTTLREKGLRRAKLFSWEEAARKTLSVYREIA